MLDGYVVYKAVNGARTNPKGVPAVVGSTPAGIVQPSESKVAAEK